MRFQVIRTSRSSYLDFDETKPPIEGVRKEMRVYIDSTSYHTIEEHDRHCPNRPWRERGTNHRVVLGEARRLDCIARDLDPVPIWTIEMERIEELTDLVKKYGPVIVQSSENAPPGWLTLELYDTDRE